MPDGKPFLRNSRACSSLWLQGRSLFLDLTLIAMLILPHPILPSIVSNSFTPHIIIKGDPRLRVSLIAYRMEDPPLRFPCLQRTCLGR